MQPVFNIEIIKEKTVVIATKIVTSFRRRQTFGDAIPYKVRQAANATSVVGPAIRCDSFSQRRHTYDEQFVADVTS